MSGGSGGGRRVVASQGELDSALADPAVRIVEVRADGGQFVLRETVGTRVEVFGSSRVDVLGSAQVRVFDDVRVAAGDSAVVYASGAAVVAASGSAVVYADGSGVVRATGLAAVHADGSVRVQAEMDVTVRAFGEVAVRAADTARVYAHGSVTVRASDIATVRAFGTATVQAFGVATVHAFGAAVVRVFDRATVYAYDTSAVYAAGDAIVHAREKSMVRASKRVVVLLYSREVEVDGGVQVARPAVDVGDPLEWCEHYGVEVRDGVAFVFKAVDKDWSTLRGVDYSPGSSPVAPDWRDDAECGGGLHFGPTPHHALMYYASAARFVRVGVEVDRLRPIVDSRAPKCKAPRVVVAAVEVDVMGREVARS